MNCPRCGIIIDLACHGDLIFDGQVWCHRCQRYDDRLLERRSFQDLETWAQRICQAFDQDPVHLRQDPDYLPDPRKYWHGPTFILGEAFHEPRLIMLHPPGRQLMTLCHELAHLFAGQDHTEAWARTFAALIAWVKARL